jgi:hypothetical protein
MASSVSSSINLPTAAPAREYATRRADRERRAAALAARERLVGNGRLVVFALGLVLGYLAIGPELLPAWWALVPLAVFSALLLIHERVTRAWWRARRAVAFYDAGQARLGDAWRGRGQPGNRYLDETHPCAADLDLFGPGSLFELLCTARTRTGEDTLAGWLRGPAAPEEVRARQAAVAELRPQLDLREDLALLGSDVPAGVDFDAVVAWGAGPDLLRPRWPRWVALALGLAALVCLAGWVTSLLRPGPPPTFFHRWGSLPLVLVLAALVAFALSLRRRVEQVLSAVEKRGRDLAMLANVLARLEDAEFAAPRLRELRAALGPANGGGGGAPSQRIAQLTNLIDVLESRRNQFFMPFAYLLLWGTQVAYSIEAWRARSGKHISGWLATVGQFEALCALAAYAYENPDDPFPEVIEQGPLYEGEGLGHPLLPAGRCVRNDLALSTARPVLIVSGSNMSGKSTFLRTVGINAVLALAGAPVRAGRLRISPLVAGATLRIQDSLQQGRSRFFTEILRLEQIVELSRGRIPLLFLLDEVLAGTNSHDRRIGAEGVVRGLVEAGAIGLVTTHDLSLTQIAEKLPGAANVHFADHFEHGEMIFDYKLRPGVVQHSNALALMRAVGLRV